MSSPLAIAAVTALLKDLLNEGVINGQLDIANDVTVTSQPPDRVATNGAQEKTQLNIFLYHVTPNLGWRNADLPSRNDRGERIANPPLALDLHYLLTAHSPDDIKADVLLGYGMHLLHENPVFPRQRIRDALAPAAIVNGTGLLPPAFLGRPAADLAEQIEQLRITPQYLSTEEMSKLWTAFQTHYRPSAAYLVTVVLIESTKPARSPLPVLTRGKFDAALGRDAGVVVHPDLLPPFPTLLEIEPQKKQTAVRMGETLTVRGHHLAGTKVVARFTQPTTQQVLELDADPGASATEFKVTIPPDPPAGPPVAENSPQNPDNWQAGLYSLAAVVTDGTHTRVSNELAVALAPKITPPLAPPDGAGNLTLKCSPKARRTQRISVLVRDRETPADAFPGDASDTLTFKTGVLSKGEYPVRLRVDGVESILVDREATQPKFFTTEVLTIP